MSKKKIYGNCRICGLEKKLTQEHYIPRAAGGARKLKLYKGEELIKTLHKDKDGKEYKPRGIPKQSGLTEYTLCKECNEYSGLYYDKDFSLFYNVIHFGVLRNIDIPKNTTAEQYLKDTSMKMVLKGLKPLNIAKRILVSFSSVEHAGLTERNTEIRKAILDKDYVPDTEGFGLYLSLHTGNSLHYGTIIASNLDGKISAFAGIENDFIALYLTTDTGTKVDGLEDCQDITHWLTGYEYDEEVDVELDLNFNLSKCIRFPIPE